MVAADTRIHLLARVAQAAARRAEVQAEYRDAVCAARAAGITLEQVAAAAGVSAQAVSKLVRRTE